MTVNVPLDDAVAAALTAQAAAQGISLTAYLEALLQSRSRRVGRRLSVAELDQLLDEEATVGPSPGGTFTRVELYSDHD
jgi:hypothetical protein